MHRGWLIAPVVAGLVAVQPSCADADGWGTASDLGRDALVVAALGAPALEEDWHASARSGLGMLSAGGATWVLKETVRERRPDGSDYRSFPSGHTSISFASAMSLERRYGWKLGFPALGVATFVGVSRVAARKHFVHDVLAGAAIGGAAGWLLSTPKNDRVQMLPWMEDRGGGFTMVARW